MAAGMAHTDVLVVGAGIAGVSASIEAACAGASVTLASLGDTFSGASFYGGTWGLGLVGPASGSDDDVEDFMRTICAVGRGVGDPELVRTLVEGIGPSVAWLESLHVVLRRAENANQRAFVPCFDHRTRSWHGLERESLRRAWDRELRRLGVRLLPRSELVELVESDGRVVGALLADHARGVALHVPCGAVVLATGGLSGLFARRLSGDDVSAACHGIALAHGCSLVNAEFLQMMPGLVAPVSGVVANEKAWRYATMPLDQALLDERSGYGPFTSSRAARDVDFAIEAAGPEGLEVSYHLPAEPPEFVTTYFDWFAQAWGIRPDDTVRLALYAHASNGGIAIAPDTSCVGGSAGLFACGECAGGMHGADRVGGLASASALVFGRRAGIAAAKAAGRGHALATEVSPEWMQSPQTDAIVAELRRTMGAHAMVVRTGEGLAIAEQDVSDLQARLLSTSSVASKPWHGASTMRAANQLTVASVMLRAMQARTESRGSHWREDFPTEDPGMERQLPHRL